MQVLLSHHLIPLLLIMMTQVGSLSFVKVLTLPILLIIFTTFLATISCLLPILPLFLLSLTVPKSVTKAIDHLGWQ